MRYDENKLTYEDFEIGQYVTLIKELPFDNGSRVGDAYEITDLDFHFPNSICVNIINKAEKVNISGFFGIEYFDSTSVRREKIIDEILEDE